MSSLVYPSERRQSITPNIFISTYLDLGPLPLGLCWNLAAEGVGNCTPSEGAGNRTPSVGGGVVGPQILAEPWELGASCWMASWGGLWALVEGEEPALKGSCQL